MRVLILGSAGFVGRHLAREALARGHAVEGWTRHARGDAPHESTPHRDTPYRDTPYREIAVDLRDASTYPRASPGAEEPFDAVFLLAGHSVPGADFGATHARDNHSIARCALEFLSETSPGARVVVMSSSHVHAPPRDGAPIDESAPLAPQSAYGHSKLAVEALARAFAARLDIVIVRSFHLIGPGMPAGLLIPDVLAAIERGDDPIRLSGADGVRDFLDVRDGARALVGLTESAIETPATFVLCRGTGTRVVELARGLCAARGVRRDVLARAGDPAPFVGDPRALRRAIGFVPRHTFQETLSWIANERS